MSDFKPGDKVWIEATVDEGGSPYGQWVRTSAGRMHYVPSDTLHRGVLIAPDASPDKMARALQEATGRTLVVIEYADPGGARLNAASLEENGYEATAAFIRRQVAPPRMAEPGLDEGIVVLAHTLEFAVRSRFRRYTDITGVKDRWIDERGDTYRWDDLIDPQPVGGAS